MTVKRLMDRLTGQPDRPPPPDREIYAVGDIHGRADLLELVVESIDARSETQRPEIIFLGDYIDRGPDSRQVVDFLLSSKKLRRFDMVFLKGNHEETLLQFLDDPGVGPSWLQYGGGETLLSYGVRLPKRTADDPSWQEASRALSKYIPDSHLTFYRSLQLSAERGPYLFVHAGVDPARPLDSQSEHDLLWIRDAFLNDGRVLDRLIVHGHTPEDRPVHNNRRVGLDTGAYQTGKLTAARFFNGRVEFYST